MQIFLFTFVFISQLLVFARANDSIEAQMRINTLGDGTKAFKITWDEKHKTAVIAIKLNWENYSPEIHAQGFNLKSGIQPYLRFPELPQGCKLKAIEGMIGNEELEDNLLYLILIGEKCPSIFNDFKIPGLKLSVSQVKRIHSKEHIQRFDIHLVNAPTTIDIN